MLAAEETVALGAPANSQAVVSFSSQTATGRAIILSTLTPAALWATPSPSLAAPSILSTCLGGFALVSKTSSEPLVVPA